MCVRFLGKRNGVFFRGMVRGIYRAGFSWNESRVIFYESTVESVVSFF